MIIDTWKDLKEFFNKINKKPKELDQANLNELVHKVRYYKKNYSIIFKGIRINFRTYTEVKMPNSIIWSNHAGRTYYDYSFFDEPIFDGGHFYSSHNTWAHLRRETEGAMKGERTPKIKGYVDNKNAIRTRSKIDDRIVWKIYDNGYSASIGVDGNAQPLSEMVSCKDTIKQLFSEANNIYLQYSHVARELPHKFYFEKEDLTL